MKITLPEVQRRTLVRRYKRASRLVSLIVLPHPVRRRHRFMLPCYLHGPQDFTIPPSSPDGKLAFNFSPAPSCAFIDAAAAAACAHLLLTAALRSL
jgi:hypothetical protein